MQDDQVQWDERQKRLREWFKSKPQVWADLKAEIEQSINNTTVKLKSPSSGGREYYSGKWSGLEEVLDLERKYK